MRKGFTLIEVLVALFISVLVMTSVLGSLDYTQRAVDAIHNVIETESAGPRILGQIRDDLSRIAVFDSGEYSALQGENRAIGGADADRLDLLVYRQSATAYQDLLRDVDVRAPLLEVGYALRQHPTLSDFLELYRREDFLVDEKPWEDGTFTLLYDSIIGLDIRYYEKPEQDPIWEDEWDSHEQESLPFALEIRLELEIQPRRSAESMGILGANKARLDFEDMFVIPASSRWVFRNRLHPILPGTEVANAPNDTGEEGANDPSIFSGGGAGVFQGGGDQRTRGGNGARGSSQRGSIGGGGRDG